METQNAPETAAETLLERAARLSHYARRLIESDPALTLDAGLERSFSAEEMRAVLAAQPANDEDSLWRALRQLRRQTMLRLIARDLGGLAPLAEVLQTTTDLAEVTIAHALTHLHQWLATSHGWPMGATSAKAQQLHVVGMGKLGGGELNVSSDIDLVFVYPEEGETDGPRPVSNHEYFTRLGRRLIAALSEITADGSVFRVDMRLRPYGDGAPLVSSFEMLENYFVTQGRDWERYAWIKARVLSGDRGADLTELVRPFVYRRHLDYHAFASLRELHRQIRREVERRDLAGNIKLGRGGIREIEFTVQVFQLIRGGREAALRTQPTLAVLPLLAARNLLPASAVRELEQAYRFLRNLEHRLQYLDDQQTHVFPSAEADRMLIAEAMRLPGISELMDSLETQRARVAGVFDGLFAPTPGAEHALSHLWQPNADTDRCIETLAELGYRHPQEVNRRLRSMRESRRYREMPASSQSQLDRLVPLTVEAAAAERNPDSTLERILGLLESVSRRSAYLALLEEYPQALTRLATMMSASPWVAEYLTQHPILLDELLDTRSLYAAPDWAAAIDHLRVQLADAVDDTEKQMDLLRHFKHAHTIRLVAQDLAGLLTIETLSDHLSDLACVLLEEVLKMSWPTVRHAHRPDPRFAIIGYGKLGGKELGYASDLDIVFLYDDEASEAPESYARYAQRINAWLTSATPAGVLYETDLRLRPDGAGGLLVSPLASFREYQLKHAWVWEHQALTRARFVAGDRTIGKAFEALRVEILRQQRDLKTLRREVLEMRQKLLDGHPNRTPFFDLKHDPGGLIDVEFVVQYLVLGHAHGHPELTGNIGNLALLKLAARLSLVEPGQAQAAHDAYRHLRQLQHTVRLGGERYARIEPDAIAVERQAVERLWAEVFGETRATRSAPGPRRK